MSRKMTEKEFDNLMKTTIEELNLSVRAFNCLKRADRNCVEDMVKMTENDVKKLKYIRELEVKKIIEKIRSLDLDIRREDVSEEEWLEELKEKLVKKEIETKEQKSNDNKNSMRIIAKLLEIWNDDIEKEVQELIYRNI